MQSQLSFAFPSPDILIRYFSISFDGTTFHLVFSPGGTLAGSVTVVSKFALATPLGLLWSAETAVANSLCETTGDKKKVKNINVPEQKEVKI